MGEPLTLPEPSAVGPGHTLRILEFTGRLTYGEQSEERYEELCRHLQEGAREIVFDLSRVPDMDSAGLGFLVMCLTTIERSGGQLRLAKPSNRVLYALLITKLDTVFALFDSVEAAVSAPRG